MELDAAGNAEFGIEALELPVAALAAGDSMVTVLPDLEVDTLRAWPDAIALRAFVDSANAVAESNETDNVYLSAPITIRFAVRSVTANTDAASFTELGSTQDLTAVVNGYFDRVLERAVTWRSTAAGVASVDEAGQVTAHSNGNALIIVSAEGREDTVAVSVNEPVASVEITSDTIWFRTLGRSAPLTALVRDGLGATVETAVVWTSLDESVATISAGGLVTAVAAGLTHMVAQAGAHADTLQIRVQQTVHTVTVAPGGAALGLGESVQLAASAQDSSGAPMTSAAFAWQSSNESVATVDANGLVQAVGDGEAAISAAFDGVQGVANVTVAAADLVVESLVLVPGDSVREGLPLVIQGAIRNAGNAASAAAFVTLSLRNAGNNEIISHHSLPLPALAAGESLPVAVPLVADTLIDWPDFVLGIVTVDSANTVAEANESNNELVSISYPVRFRVDSVEAAPQTLALTQLGATANIAATLRDRYDRVLTGRLVAFVSSNPAVALVQQNGEVTAVATGTADIYVLSETRADTVAVTVTQLASTIQLSTTSTTTFQALGRTAVVVAVVKDASGAVIPDAIVEWTSSNPSIISVDDNGLLTALANGQVNIVATSGGATQNMIWTVEQSAASLTVSPATATIADGATVQLSAAVQDETEHAMPTPPLNWTSSNEAVATVSVSGLVTANAPGEAVITARIGESTVEGSATITVEAGEPAQIAFDGVASRNGTVNQPVDDSLAVRVTDAQGNLLDDVEIVWTHADGTLETSFSSLDYSGGVGMRPETLPPTSITTRTNNGYAKVRWKLPTRSGQHSVDACVANTTLCVTFNGSAQPDRPSKANKKNGSDDQLVTVNQTAPNALELVVMDQFDNPTPDATVEWSLSAPGHGAISASTTSTNADGVAAITWTMPITRGVFFVNYTVKDGPTVITAGQFKGNAKPDKPNKHNKNGDDQTVTVNQTAPNALELTITDQFDNPIEGAPVDWSLGGGHVDGALSAASSTTDADGKATVSWSNVGKKAGLMLVEYSVTHDGATLTGTFKARARAGRAAKGNKKAAADNQDVIVNRVAPNAVEITVLDEFDNPTAGTVEWTLDGPGHGALSSNVSVVDTLTGAATVMWTMPITKGQYTVDFVVKDTAGVPVASGDFRANAKPDKPSKHNKNADDQTVTVNQTAPNALELTVMDEFDNPIEGVTVNWSLAAGHVNGALSSNSSVTNELGVATVSWTNVGTKAGLMFVDYSLTHDGATLTGTFKARARAGRAAKGNKKAAADNQEVLVNRVAPNAVEITVLDEFDNPTAGTVEWTLDGPGHGALSSNVSVVDTLTGAATVMWTMPITKGQYTVDFVVKDTAGVPVASGDFKANAKPDKPTNHNKKDGTDEQVVTVAQVAANALEVTVSDSFGNVVDDAVVEWSLRAPLNDADLSETITPVNAEGKAAVTWTVGKKSGNVFVDYVVTQGGIEYAAGSFRATANPGPLRKIRFNQESFAFDAFNSEAPITTQGEDEYQNPVTVIPGLSSRDGTVASVVDGKVRGHKNDTTYILATSGGVTDSVQVTIAQRIKTLLINERHDTITALQFNKQLTHKQKDANGNDITDLSYQSGITWVSLHPAIATIDPITGLLTSVTNGTATVQAIANVDNSVLDEVFVEVRQAAAAGGITFHGGVVNGVMAEPPTTIITGSTIQLYAHAIDSNNRPVRQWTWVVQSIDAGSASFQGNPNQQKDSVITILGGNLGTVRVIATDARGSRSDTINMVIINVPQRPLLPGAPTIGSGAGSPDAKPTAGEPVADKPRPIRQPELR